MSTTSTATEVKIKGIPHTEAIKGERVTTYNQFGGVGIGYLVDGVVWRTTGSYWALNAKDDVFPMVSFVRDGGRGYLVAVSRALGAAVGA